MAIHSMVVPLDDGSVAKLVLEIPISAADAERIATVVGCLVLEEEGE